jgi:hypothetical protein
MERVTVRYNGLHAVLVAAILVTAGIHLYLGIKFADVLFLLNAIGYVGLTGLFLIPLEITQRFHEVLRWVLIFFAGLTIILWAIINGTIDAVGVTAKTAEVLIIVLLLVDRNRST